MRHLWTWDLLPGSGEHCRFQQLLDFDPEELDRIPATKYRLMDVIAGGKPISFVRSDDSCHCVVSPHRKSGP